MTARSFESANDRSRERLTRLVAALTPSQLEIDLGEGWTVASALAHTGFWDRWQAARWTEMLAGRWNADAESVIAAEHLANEALHPYWAGVAAPDIPGLAVEAAVELDALIASAPDELVEALLAGPSAFMVNRFGHRSEHLDHIERSIAAAASSAAESPAAGQAGDRSFVEKNAASRRRLASLVERLRESDLTLLTDEGGWTIAQSLGHLAFWDRSMETRWHMAVTAAPEGAAIEPHGIPSEMTDAINLPLAGLLDSWTAQVGLGIGRQAIDAAESLDALIVELADRLPSGVAAGRPNLVNRWVHREAHLADLEAALAKGRPAAAAVDRSFMARNAASLAQLRDLLGRLSAADLARQVADGEWTVGQALGHLAFWDRFLAGRWRSAPAGGTGEQPGYLPHELADLLNDSLQPTWEAFAVGAGQACLAEALAAAEDVDRIIAGLPDSTPIDAILVERPALLDRSMHRLEHMAQIERALGTQADGHLPNATRQVR